MSSASSSLCWHQGPIKVTIDGSEVHVWRLTLDNREDIDDLAENASTEELTRAQRFRFEQDRIRFLAGRGLLRAILGRYLDMEDGKRLAFQYESHGKPRLANAEGHGLEFNLSHSRGIALCAVAWKRRLGIDVEYVRPVPDLEQIVTRFFSESEQSAFAGLPASLKTVAFFRGWTRKEAYLKAIGTGLTTPLAGFDVSLTPGEPPQLLKGLPSDAAPWSLRDVDPAANYLAALAVEGDGWQLRCYEIP